MALVPSGKTRVMVAQNFSNPLSDGFNEVSIADGNGIEPDNRLDTEKALEEDVGGDVVNEGVNVEENEVMEPQPQEKGRKTLTTYIYEKLQTYGYPGRRLNDFKKEFVKETVSPDGIKDIQVIIPDKKYQDERGLTDTIENEELRDISQEINKLFGLNFNGAARDGGKWTIKFTSADLSDPDEQEIVRDDLDQVYGKPDKSKSEQRSGRRAFTIREMIKEQKNKLINKLKKIIGEKNASENVKST